MSVEIPIFANILNLTIMNNFQPLEIVGLLLEGTQPVCQFYMLKWDRYKNKL